MAAKQPFDLHDNQYYKKSLFSISDLNCEKEFWNVNETISELAYLTHDYFRYYGKFPSKIGKMIIEDLQATGCINSDTDFILDNYAGSGTTLVEAKLAGIDSIGIDINPFAVLACKVKTYNYDVSVLRGIWEPFKEKIVNYSNADRDDILSLIVRDIDEQEKKAIEVEADLLINDPEFQKWFSDEVLKQLSIIKYFLLHLPYSREREFFDLGFFAIIRRVSYAHDAEVRPHVNKKKRKRNAIEAYIKKIEEMLSTMEEWNQAANHSVYSNAYVVDNSNADMVKEVIAKERTNTGKQLGAVISHPPYLNCFDYIPVYKLKFMWAKGFEEIFSTLSYDEIKKSEIKSYPVNNDAAIDRYFEHNYHVYENVRDNLKQGGYCCIIIGDCTVKKELFSIHKAFIIMMEEIGFTLKKMAYRSTAYGMGRYAYNFRADYSENADGKQDAILFFEKK